MRNDLGTVRIQHRKVSRQKLHQTAGEWLEELQLQFCPSAEESSFCAQKILANHLSNCVIRLQVHNKSVGMTFAGAPSLLLLSSLPTLTENVVIKRLQEALELSLNLRGNWYKHEMTYCQKHCMNISAIRE